MSNPTKEKEDSPKKAESKLNIRNTLMKFLLDMTLGAIVNTYLFIALIGVLKGMRGTEVLEACNRVGISKPQSAIN